MGRETPLALAFSSVFILHTMPSRYWPQEASMASAAFIGAIFVWGRTAHCNACPLRPPERMGSDPKPWHGRLARHTRLQPAGDRLLSGEHAAAACRAIRAKES
jgi:hypothetical protein